jgi:hypothetical protein
MMATESVKLVGLSFGIILSELTWREPHNSSEHHTEIALIAKSGFLANFSN